MTYPEIPSPTIRVPSKSSDSAVATKRRQSQLLMKISKLCEHRTDIRVPLQKVDQAIKIDGEEFVTYGDDESGLRAYDLTILWKNDLITCSDPTLKPGIFFPSDHITHPKSKPEDTSPATIWITQEGLHIVAKAEKVGGPKRLNSNHSRSSRF